MNDNILIGWAVFAVLVLAYVLLRKPKKSNSSRSSRRRDTSSSDGGYYPYGADGDYDGGD